MAATEIPKSLDDSCILVRATNENLAESDPSAPRLMRSLSTNGGLYGASQPGDVHSMSCRQIYLRSYSFSRKESMPEKLRTCASWIKRSVSVRGRDKKVPGGAHGGFEVIRKAREIWWVAMNVIFRRLLSCTTKVDVGG